MATPTEQISESFKEGLVNFKEGLINFINKMISSIASGYEIYLIFIISILIAIIITRWHYSEREKENKKYLFTIITTLLLYFSFRFIGIGN